MFTGIIETTGQIKDVKKEGSNRHFNIQSSISEELKVDQSVAHDGVCLTVTGVDKDSHWVTAIDETLKKSILGTWQPGKSINLERCMKADSRFDGHIVQGHVDGVAKVENIEEEEGSWVFTFAVANTQLMVEKGSITINGTSLTCFDVTDGTFKVAIIPYTYQHTTFQYLKSEHQVNLEFDIIGKYVQKMVRN